MFKAINMFVRTAQFRIIVSVGAGFFLIADSFNAAGSSAGRRRGGPSSWGASFEPLELAIGMVLLLAGWLIYKNSALERNIDISIKKGKSNAIAGRTIKKVIEQKLAPTKTPYSQVFIEFNDGNFIELYSNSDITVSGPRVSNMVEYADSFPYKERTESD